MFALLGGRAGRSLEERSVCDRVYSKAHGGPVVVLLHTIRQEPRLFRGMRYLVGQLLSADNMFLPDQDRQIQDVCIMNFDLRMAWYVLQTKR